MDQIMSSLYIHMYNIMHIQFYFDTLYIKMYIYKARDLVTKSGDNFTFTYHPAEIQNSNTVL